MYHENPSTLSEKTLNLKRAIDSLREELEAIDWYAQRQEHTTNKALKEILKHNQEEETEHAVMLIEWLRRHDETFDEMLKKYLFKEKDIMKMEEENEGK